MILEFASSKRTRKTRTCAKGYNCGNSCINKGFKCKKKFSDQASTYAGWLKKQAQRLEDIDPSKKKNTEQNERPPLNDQDRSNPDKLIEVGKAFAAKYNLENSEKEYSAYQKAKTSHITSEKARVEKVNNQRQPILGRLREIDNELFNTTDFDKRDLLNAEADRLQAKLKPLTAQTYRKPFDKLDEIDHEIAKLPGDRFLLRATKTQAEYKQKKEETDLKRAELTKQRSQEEQKLPGYKELANTLQGITARSGLDKNSALDLVEQNVKFKTKAGTEGRVKYSTLGTKAEIAQMKSDIVDITQLSGEREGKLNVVKESKKLRAYAAPNYKLNAQRKIEYSHANINVGNSYAKNLRQQPARQVMFHEFGHTLEFQHQEIAAANNKWIRDRATSSDVKPIYGKQDEVAYPDNFIDPYVGKYYNADERGYIASEVLTMGIQHFTDSASMRKLFDADPEHFYLTLGSIIEIQNKNKK